MRLRVIEDDARRGPLVKRALEEEGHSVDLVRDGREGEWMARENPYAAIVLDVMLPGMDGFEVCRALRRGGCWSPIVILTARGDVSDRVEGLDSGADDYLVKPFSLAELAARVRALIRRGETERPSVLEVGDLRLDPATHQAWRGDVELSLTAKELALLELFLRNPGTVLTRASIIEQVWDWAYDGTSNVIDQYVRYLRSKVDRPFGRRDLETVRGVGYRLRDPSKA